MAVPIFDSGLVSRYNVNGPRYTSYPTANEFREGDFAAPHAEALAGLADGAPLSLYVHVPFCATICYYCACNKVNTANHRRAGAYVEHLVREMALQARFLSPGHPVEQLHFGGGTPTFLDDAQLREVFAGLHEHFELIEGPERDYSIEIDPRKLPPERVDVLADLGFNRMSLGIQDFDPRVQQAINRIQSEAETRAIVRAARANGFASISVDLIYGLPLQTVRGFERTLARVLALDPDRISLYSYAHLPQRFKTQRQIRIEDLPSPETKLALLATAIDFLGTMGYEYVGMDHFAKPGDSLLAAQRAGRLHRNFQGYTTHGHCELIGLGVSAIGKVGRVYAQNAKVIDDYYAAIERGELALERGYVLNDDDVVVGDVIQRLMCHFELDLEAFEARHGMGFYARFPDVRERLQPMVDEGLVSFTPDRVRVTPKGRYLIRNVCMAFDAHLAPATTGFSKAI